MERGRSPSLTDNLYEGGLVAAGEQAGGPSAWVGMWLPLAPHEGATALDVACGRGRHVRLAHGRGYDVTGVDRDVSGVEGFTQFLEPGHRAGVRLIGVDLEAGTPWWWARQPFDVVIVTNYLHRPRLRDLVGAVAADGMLIYETFAVGHERFGKPSNPDFLLRPGELLEAKGRLVPFAYEHVVLGGSRIVQRIVAVGPEHQWIAGRGGALAVDVS